MGSARSIRAGIGAMLAVGVTASLVLAAPASAYLRDVVFVADRLGATPFSPKRLEMRCPGRGIALAGGGNVEATGARTYALIASGASREVAARVGWIRLRGPLLQRPRLWAVRGAALCSNPTSTPPPPAAAAPYLKGVQIVSATSALDSVPKKNALARCPPGKSAIAGGHEVRDDRIESGGTPAITVSSPIDETWFAVADELRPTPDPWSVTVHVVCANASTAPSTPTSNYVGDVSFHQALSPPGSQARSIRANCPLGREPIGGGAEVQGSTPGTPPPGGVVQVGSSMRFSIRGQIPGHWEARGKELFPTSATWRVRAWAVCASLHGPGPAPPAQ